MKGYILLCLLISILLLALIDLSESMPVEAQGPLSEYLKILPVAEEELENVIRDRRDYDDIEIDIDVDNYGGGGGWGNGGGWGGGGWGGGGYGGWGGGYGNNGYGHGHHHHHHNHGW